MKKDNLNWKAAWIWGDSGPEETNWYQAFRHKFSVGQLQDTTRLSISADSRYVLYLNGERIGQGPSRSWPSEQSYDIYDITSRLREGENLVSVLVHYLGMSNFQYIAGRGGLLCQIESVDESGQSTLIAKTDESWRTIPHPGYERKALRICCQLGYEEQFDAQKDLRLNGASWLDPHFPDDGWDTARVIGPVGTAPWTSLARRSIPFLTEEPILPVDVLSRNTVRPIPYSFSVDLHSLFCPEKKDANREELKGALVMVIHVAKATEITWHKFEVYGFGGVVRVNGELVDFEGSLEASVNLKEGSNLVVVDLCGEWHDLVLPFGIWSPEKLEFTLPWQVQAGDEAIFGYVDGNKERDDLLSEVIGLTGVEELANNGPMVQSIEVIPPAAVLGNIYAKTSRRHTVEEHAVVIEDAWNLFAGNRRGAVVYPSPNGLHLEILLDFGREMVGFLEFEVFCHAGVVLDWNLFEGIQEGTWLFTDRLNNTLRYTTRDGRQFHHSHVRRGFRYALLTIRNLQEPMVIGDIRCLLNTYPYRNRAYFQCSDYLLNEIWEMCRYTTRLCSEDTYVDCPAYEQAFWVGDARNEALIDYYVNGDYRLAKRCLGLVAKSLERSPLPESQVPSGWQDILTAWSLLWVLASKEHYDYTGDEKFLRELYPALRQTCRTFLRDYLNEDNLLEIEAWNMLDWAPMDTPREGVVTHQNAWLVKALREVAKIAVALDVATSKEDHLLFTEGADKIKEAINRHLWSKEHQAFVDCRHVDGRLSEIVSQQTNTIVYLCDCVDGERKELMAKYVGSVPEDWVSIGSPFMMFFSFEALAKQGRFQEILDWTRHYWGLMLDNGATTCWETFPGFQKDRWTRSHCHAWSAGPGYFLPAYQLGVRPLKPGFSQVLIKPETADLAWCKGIVPSPRGDIEVSWEKARDFSLSVKLPLGVDGVIELPLDARDPRIVEGDGTLAESASGGWQVIVTGAGSVSVVMYLG
ncbi:MAG: alpha-L-rhamnosidase [Firmicutes bacterium]|nr:alpha-L-rhamnosidase [Bacillota bacterium]